MFFFMDGVVIPAPILFDGDVVVRFKLRNDPMSGALRDADLLRNVSKPHVWVLRQAVQNVKMVRHKGPGGVTHMWTIYMR